MASLLRMVAAFRWLVVPVGVFALVAVGVHAGADVLDDVLLRALDFADGWADRVLTAVITAVYGLFDVAPSRVDAAVAWATELVDLDTRVTVVRALALGLELFSILVLAMPAFGQNLDESSAPKPRPRAATLAPPPSGARLPAMLKATFRDPTAARLLLPPAVFAVALAGACAVATELQTSAFAVLHHGMPASLAGSLGRLVGFVVLGSTLVLLGSRAVVGAVEHGYRLGENDRLHRFAGRRLRGLVPALAFVPLALAALLHGAPLLSFVR